MPAPFKGDTQYNRVHTWMPSFKSASFVPSKEQSAPQAGVPSTSIGVIQEPAFTAKKKPDSSMHDHGNLLEPALQRRKKPLQAATTETTHWVDSSRSDEYMLLGNQDKFAKNVRYQPKNTAYIVKCKEENDGESTPVTPPPAPRIIPPAPKVSIDTGAPSKHSSPDKPKTKTKSTATNTKLVQNGITKDTKQEKKPLTDKKKSPSPPKPSLKEAQKSKTVQKPKVVAHTNGDMNEFTQTDLENGVADSGQEAPPNYALKFKTGVAPPRSRGPKRVSEYQMQYKWQKGLSASPLLAAEQVVHKSSTNIGPYKSEGTAKISEYRREFAEHKYKPVAKEEPAKKAKLQRSKSLEAVNPSSLPAAGTSKVTSDEDRRLLSASMNPLKLHFPHGKYKKHQSEYNSNFNDPTRVSYVDGAWQGVKPPHIQQHQPTVEEAAEPNGDITAASAGSWFSEVLELRKKAAEYKNRARGTHFSRTHLGQLFAQQTDLWDSHSTISALSLETGSQLSVKGPTIKQAWDVKAPSRSRTESLVSSQPSERSDISDVSTLRGEALDAEGGRLPTPQIRSSPYVRHHLDRTTPSVGGALLTSPPNKRKQKVSEAADDLADNLDSASVPSPQQQKQPKSKVARGTTPTYGMPTRDSHVLVDEDASVDQPLQTQFVHSPQVNKVRHARERFPKADIPSTIDEGGADTYKKSTLRPAHDDDDDDDRLSVASLASSCSMASQVLERARNRRDEFWGKNGQVH